MTDNEGARFLFYTAGIVVLTSVVNATTSAPLVRKPVFVAFSMPDTFNPNPIVVRFAHSPTITRLGIFKQDSQQSSPSNR